jgi:hypothetical protein
MKEHQQRQVEQLLKKSLPPIGARAETELQHDLWPSMRERLDEPPAAVPWFDWALLAAVGTLLVFYPGAIPVLLYHL